jgi:dephospho-CoA kinase
MHIVGLTGGIACGKSSVSLLVQKKGVVVVDLDVVARQVVEVGERAYRRIVDHFGECILQIPGGPIDRGALGKSVFSHPEERAFLNGATHPEIRKCVLWTLISEWWKGTEIVLLDVPLLLESSFYKWIVGTIVVVGIPRELQLQRLLGRNPDLSEEDAIRRIDAQMPIDTKKKMAHFFIDNSGEMEELATKVDEAWEDVIERGKRRRRKQRFFFTSGLVAGVGIIWGIWSILR